MAALAGTGNKAKQVSSNNQARCLLIFIIPCKDMIFFAILWYLLTEI